MKKELFCQYCDMDVAVHYVKEKVVHRINNEDIEVEVMIPYCKQCQKELSDFDLEEERYNLVYSKYRKMKNLLSPDEIRQLREQYGLSQRAFSRVLGFSESTINRYELGALQDNIHNTIMLLANNPTNMQLMVQQNITNLSKGEQIALIAKLKELVEMNGHTCLSNQDSQYERLLQDVSKLQSSIDKIEKKVEQVDI